MIIFEEMRRACEAAAVDRLGEVAAAVWKAYGAGGLTDEQAEQLDGLLSARRGAARAAPVRTPTLALIAAQVVPAAAPAPKGQGTASNRNHARTGSRPRSAESLCRRRRWAAAGYLPPKIAAGFTSGEQAVLAVVGREIATKGRCTLARGHIAALAGVEASTVKRAMRQAALVGLVDIELRRITGFRNDTNRVTIASREWATWLRTRLPRSVQPGLGGGGQLQTGTRVVVTDRATRPARSNPLQGPIAHQIAPPGLRHARQTPRPAAR
ncbi:hypothetical protein MKK75_03880 [Methylobacterium sp. J-030]|uniref:hypothetical protein n=1 Tax=Methylobacterium sp. J-030 TaxID=2836627 RepID=UPI001FB88461|nr:hypothetical protein [Methylobacterium sp. J-030]MCJ2067955.1 hypothetical protein [Methylobacterium sp. J-030]